MDAGLISIDATCFDPMAEVARVDLILRVSEWTGEAREVPVQPPENAKPPQVEHSPSSYAFETSRRVVLPAEGVVSLRCEADLGAGLEQLTLVVTRGGRRDVGR